MRTLLATVAMTALAATAIAATIYGLGSHTVAASTGHEVPIAGLRLQSQREAGSTGDPEAPLPDSDEPSACTQVSSKVAEPKAVTLGRPVDITMVVNAECPSEERAPLHLVLVLDASGSMAGAPNRLLRNAASLLVKSLDMKVNASVKVGVVQFAGSAQTLCHLTNDEEELLRCIANVGASGGSRPDEGIALGHDVMKAGRVGLPRNVLTEVMVVLSDGPIQEGCDAVLARAREARGQGVLLISICVTDACDEDCMRQVASGPRYYFKSNSGAGLITVFGRLLERIPDMSIYEIVITDTLSSGVQFVPDSADPPQTAPSQPEGWLSWRNRRVSTDAMTVTYQVLPQEVGTMHTSVSTVGWFVDWRGRSRVWLFDAPWIEVVPPRTATPTPTGTPPTPTATPTRTRFVPTPTTTPTPERRLIYLPLALRELGSGCATDVVLVIDTSESMRELASCGDSKLECAQEAIIEFLLAVDLDGRAADQVGLVAFHGDARVVHQLSGDRPSLLRAVGSLDTSQGTRLDLGIALATDELGSERRLACNVPAMIVLTDGRVQPVPPRLAIEEAGRAKGRGVFIFAIGLGNEVLVETLKAVASDADYLYLAPDADDLPGIFEQIAARMARPWQRRWQ